MPGTIIPGTPNMGGISANFNKYQPALQSLPNPLSNGPVMGGVQAPAGAKDTAKVPGIQAAMAKRGSQDNGAQRLSSAGESSGVKFKHDNDGHATGSSAFDTLDGYMKKAGLNSFQTQFFTRLIESGMTEPMIQATIKTASDQFGEKTAAELQDGYEKLATLGTAALKLLGSGASWAAKKVPGVVSKWLPGAAKATTQGAATAAGKAATKKAPGVISKAVTSGRAALNDSTVGKAVNTAIPKGRAALNDSTVGKAVNTAGTRVAEGVSNRAPGVVKGVGKYVGSPELIAAGRTGGGIKNMASAAYNAGKKDFSKGLRDRAITGTAYGALDPTGGVLDPNATWGERAANMAAGGLMGTVGGKGGQRLMRRSVAGQGAGNLVGLGQNLTGYGSGDGLVEDMRRYENVGRMAGLFAPNTIGAIPGVAGGVARMGSGKAGWSTGARALEHLGGVKGMGPGGWAGKQTTKKTLQKLINKPLSTGFNETGRGNLGLLDGLDPMNQVARAGGGLYRKAIAPVSRGIYDKALAPAGRFIANHPTGVSSAATGAALTGMGAVGLDRVSDAANNATEQANQTAALGNEAIMDLHGRGVEGIDEMKQQGADTMGAVRGDIGKKVDEFVTPENIAKTVQETMKGPAGEQLGGIMGFMQNVGGSIFDGIESVLGEPAANYMKQNWPMLLTTAVLGGGAGALLGGGKGAALGGLGAPLAMMIAQQMGVGQAAGGADTGGGGGDPAASAAPAPAPTVTPGSTPATTRNELEAASAPPTPAEAVAPLVKKKVTKREFDPSKPPAYLDPDGDGVMSSSEAEAAGSGKLLSQSINDPNAAALAAYQYKTNPEFRSKMEQAATTSPWMISMAKGIPNEDAVKLQAMARKLQGN